MTLEDEAALLVVRHRWALEELTLDALYRELNVLYGDARGQFRYVRRLYRSKTKAREARQAGRLFEACEELALYRFSLLRQSHISMMLFVMEENDCSFQRLVYDLRWVVTWQGRRKTLGVVDAEIDRVTRKECTTGKTAVKRKRRLTGWAF